VQNIKDEKYLKEIGARIRSIREGKNLTQVELGVMCNNYGEQIGRIERGKFNVTVCTLKVIAEALGVKVSDLVDPI